MAEGFEMHQDQRRILTREVRTMRKVEEIEEKVKERGVLLELV